MGGGDEFQHSAKSTPGGQTTTGAADLIGKKAPVTGALRFDCRHVSAHPELPDAIGRPAAQVVAEAGDDFA